MDIKLAMARSDFNSNRADFYMDLAEALDDKASLYSHLEKMRTRAHQRKQGISILLAQWVKRMEHGKPFSEAVRGTVPSMDGMILRASEDSGKLAQGLRFLSAAVSKAGNMKSALVSAIAMPALLTLFQVAIISGFSYFMVPILTQIMKPEKWPLLGRMLFGLSQFVVAFGPYLLILLIAGIVAFVLSLPRWTGPMRARFDRHLPYSIYRDYNGAIFLVTVAALMQSGVGLIESLKILREAGSPWMRWHISKMINSLERDSTNPAAALNTGILPPKIADRISDYGERSSFTESMGKIGLTAVDRVAEIVSKSAKTMNTVMTIFVGGTLLFLMLGVLLTAQHASQEIRSQTRKVTVAPPAPPVSKGGYGIA